MLRPAQEAVVIALRQTRWWPLDDLLAVTRESSLKGPPAPACLACSSARGSPGCLLGHSPRRRTSPAGRGASSTA